MRNRLRRGSSTMLTSVPMLLLFLLLLLLSSSSSSLMMSPVLIMVGINRYGCHLKRAKRFGVRMSGEATHVSSLQNVQNGSEKHSAFCLMDTNVIFRRKASGA